jgi:uncharacterized protein (TIGR03435 family)
MMPAVVLAFLPIASALASAQGREANAQSAYSFEVASVKPMPPDRRDRFESYCEGGGRFISRGTPLLWAIKWAYGLNDYQMSDGWPAWLNSFGTYEIEAETDRRVTADECRKMVQSLFEERFGLRMHKQSKVVSAYALIIGKNGPGKNGPKLPAAGRVTINGAVKQATSEPEPPPGWAIPRLANHLAGVRGIQRPVVDRTKLTGIYGFTLSYSTVDGDDRPDIFTALQEQLGLKLRAIKVPIEMWFVDRVERPGGN